MVISEARIFLTKNNFLSRLLRNSYSYVWHSMYLKLKRIGLIKKFPKISLRIIRFFFKFSVNIFSRHILGILILRRNSPLFLYFRIFINAEKFFDKIRFKLNSCWKGFYSTIFYSKHAPLIKFWVFQKIKKNSNTYFRILHRQTRIKMFAFCPVSEIFAFCSQYAAAVRCSMYLKKKKIKN